MRKLAKSLSALVLALILSITLCLPAFAAETYSITVENKNEAVSINGQSFSAYKLFDVTYNDQNGAISYTYNPATCLNVTYTVAGTAYSGATLITWLSSIANDIGQTRAFADHVYANYIQGKTAVASGSATAKGETASITLPTAGYYLVFGGGSSEGSAVTAAVSLSTAKPSAVVNPKFDAPTITKEIRHNETGEWGAVGDNQIGDTVVYRTTTTVPNMTGYKSYLYTIHDKMDTGLTLKGDSIQVYTDSELTNALNGKYISAMASPTDGHSFDVTVDILTAISDGILQPGDTLYTTYSAVLNQNAAIYTDGHNDNETWLEYSNNPYVTGSTGNTHHEKVCDWTFVMDVTKVDGSEQQLEGAQFMLTKSATLDEKGAIALIDDGNGAYTVAPAGFTGTTTTTIIAGKVNIKGLDDASDYYLHETVAPDGYNKLEAPVKFTVTAKYSEAGTELLAGYPVVVCDGKEATANLALSIVNQTGTLLPGTGGIGTTVFTVVGLTLVAGAAVLLVTKRRMSTKEKMENRFSGVTNAARKSFE